MYNGYVFTLYMKGGCALIKNLINSLIKTLDENLKLILVGLITILIILAGAIVISLYFGGDVSRQLIITEISGSASITRDNKKMTAGKNAKLKSGDIITTDKNGSLRISIDSGKYVLVEPNSSVYIYYTEVSEKGNISVNLSKGAVMCRINTPLKKNATFVVKTPNSTIDVKGTVFRTEFDYKSEYMGYNNVMVTQVQSFDGSVTLQLYDIEKKAKDLPMVLLERTSAQMLTAENLCQYGYLNYSFELSSMSSVILGELIRAQNSTELAFTHDEINQAYKNAIEEQRRLETMTETTTTESTAVTEITTVSEASTVTTTPHETETTQSDSHNISSTTQKTYEYTTYSGIKWWELTGNTNTGTDDYEDWFSTDDKQIDSTAETVTAGID